MLLEAWSTGSVQLTEDFGGRQLLPSDNWWNQDISRAPIDPQSSAYVDFIGRTRTAHPDFGPPPYGIPYVGVGRLQPRVPVTFVDYGSESDSGFAGESGYPIPEEAKTQANFIEGGVPGGGSSGDRHLLIVDRDKWCCTNCSPRSGTRRVSGGRRDRVQCPTCRQLPGVRKDGRRLTRPVLRFCQVSSGTTRPPGARSVMPFA